MSALTFDTWLRIGTLVLIDDDPDLRAVVTALHLRSDTYLTVTVDYFNNGQNVSVALEPWRLTPAPSLKRGGVAHTA